MNELTQIRKCSTLLRALAACGMLFASKAVSQTHPQDSFPAFAASGSPNLPAQEIGPNDLLFISVYDSPEFTRSVRVAADGTISLPLMEQSVPAAGIMPHELEVRISAALRSESLLKEPRVIVTVAEYSGRPILVTGAVRTPVTFQAVGQVTLMDALTRAGGISLEAGPEVLVNASHGTDPTLVRRVLLKPLYDASDPKLNLVLAGGDEVRVPVAARFSVLGNVKNTGSFPILDSSDSTVLGALVMAGGFAGPKPKEAYIVRRNDSQNGTHQIVIPLKEIVDRKVPDIPLLPHDILYVPTNRRSETLLALEKIAGVAGSAAFVVTVLK